MKILGIDTSTKFLGVAIIDKNDTLDFFHDKSEFRHSELLIPTIDKMLKKCHLKLKDINAIALSIGPGSFTGLRIGVATCKAINLATGIPIVAVPTLDVIAYNFIGEKEDILCPILDAKKKQVYACFYKNLKRISDYMLTDVESLLRMIDKPVLLFGDGVKLYGDICRKNPLISISTKEWHPKAEVVAKLALEKARKRKFANPDKLVPMYMHSKYCQVTES